MDNLTKIINGCIRKVEEYQRAMYERYYAFGLKIVFRYIYRYERAVEVVNDGFVKVFRHFPLFVAGPEEQQERRLMGWIRRIMINTSIDELRRGNLLPEIGGLQEDVWDTADAAEADQQILYKELVQMTRDLPSAYRAVFNLYVIDGYSHAEIGKMMGWPVGTSKANLSRARALLQKKLEKIGEARQCRI